jgi:hypothetical protein
MLVHKSKDEHVVENNSSNPIIALWLIFVYYEKI